MKTMLKPRLSSGEWKVLGWLVLSTALFTGCSSDSTADGAGGSAGSQSGGTGGSAGGAGGSGGAAGATGGAGGTLASTRKCGEGSPCADGSSCLLWQIESGISCDCDQSGHFLCDSFAGGGAPPFPSCNTESQAACQHNNGFCARSCDGAGACEVSCKGGGPEPDPDSIAECDAEYCSAEPYGGCSVKDGDCAYSVKCQGEGAAPLVAGQCAE